MATAHGFTAMGRAREGNHDYMWKTGNAEHQDEMQHDDRWVFQLDLSKEERFVLNEILHQYEPEAYLITHLTQGDERIALNVYDEMLATVLTLKYSAKQLKEEQVAEEKAQTPQYTGLTYSPMPNPYANSANLQGQQMGGLANHQGGAQ